MGDKKHWCDPGAYGALRVQRSSIYPTIAKALPLRGLPVWDKRCCCLRWGYRGDISSPEARNSSRPAS